LGYLTAVGNNFLIRTQRAAPGKILDALMQRLPVGIPEAERFALGVKPIFSSKFENPSGGFAGHGVSPCIVNPAARLLGHKKTEPPSSRCLTWEAAFGSYEPARGGYLPLLHLLLPRESQRTMMVNHCGQIIVPYGGISAPPSVIAQPM
jgi:hypothetical protein